MYNELGQTAPLWINMTGLEQSNEQDSYDIYLEKSGSGQT